jgi:hypothetical protein
MNLFLFLNSSYFMAGEVTNYCVNGVTPPLSLFDLIVAPSGGVWRGLVPVRELLRHGRVRGLLALHYMRTREALSHHDLFG